MSKIDFVPNDYLQQRESNRANFMYLILFAVLMLAVGMIFSIIKMRQKAVKMELAAVTAKMSQAQDKIVQLEELKSKSTKMMQTMIMTSELLEPVPRSVILASLTNNLPSGVSLLEIKLMEKETKTAPKRASKSQYKAASAKAAAASEQPVQKMVETIIEMVGIAPSDIEVANYIAKLSNSVLLDNVSLVESKEHKIDETSFREFKLRTMLKKNIILTREDIRRIKEKREAVL
jgi:Tfp pilus assembly protein PilN